MVVRDLMSDEIPEVIGTVLNRRWTIDSVAEIQFHKQLNKNNEQKHKAIVEDFEES